MQKAWTCFGVRLALEGGGNGNERVAGGIDHGDRRVVREGAQTIAGLGRCEGPSWFAAGVSTAPLLPDAVYMGLVLPMPGDMSAGGLVNDDDEEGWDGNIRVTICASVH